MSLHSVRHAVCMVSRSNKLAGYPAYFLTSSSIEQIYKPTNRSASMLRSKGTARLGLVWCGPSFEAPLELFPRTFFSSRPELQWFTKLLTLRFSFSQSPLKACHIFLFYLTVHCTSIGCCEIQARCPTNDLSPSMASKCHAVI